MFISSAVYRQELLNVIEHSKHLRIAVAFWGQGSDKLIEIPPGGSIRILCNLMSGGTNPAPIRSLMAKDGVDVQQLTSLHAKVILGESVAIIGSANISTNGLNHEGDEIIGWQEAGYVVTDPAQLEKIGAWFEERWGESRVVTPGDLKQAQQAWDARRHGRVSTSTKRGLLNRPPADLKDREARIVVYYELPSAEATQANEEVLRELSSNAGGEYDATKLDFFEDAEHFPADAVLIGVHVGKRNSIRIDGPYKRVPQLDRTFVDADGEKKSIQVVVETDRVLDEKFDAATRKLLRAKIKANVGKFREIADDNDQVISLYDALFDEGEA